MNSRRGLAGPRPAVPAPGRSCRLPRRLIDDGNRSCPAAIGLIRFARRCTIRTVQSDVECRGVTRYHPVGLHLSQAYCGHSQAVQPSGSGSRRSAPLPTRLASRITLDARRSLFAGVAMNKKFASCAACLAVIVAVATAQTPLPAVPDQFYAAIRGNDNAQIETLLRNGAAVDVRDRRGGATPLMNAAAFGSIETMKLLIDKGADVNARSTAGATALMWAVDRSREGASADRSRRRRERRVRERPHRAAAGGDERPIRTDRPPAAVAWRERPGHRYREDDDVEGGDVRQRFRHHHPTGRSRRERQPRRRSWASRR